jgi:O-antigen ligase
VNERQSLLIRKVMLKNNNMFHIAMGALFLFSSFTGLRVAGPVGIGEVFGFLLLVFFLSSLSIAALSRTSRAQKYYMSFLLLFFMSLVSGWIIGLVSGKSEIDSAVRNFFALSFSMGLSFMYVNELRSQSASMSFYRGIKNTTLFLIIPLFFLSLVKPQILGVSLWFHDVMYYKWIGFSNNPNQIGLLFVTLPFLALFYRGNNGTPWSDNVFLVGAVFIGLSCQSSALIVAWFCGVIYYFFLNAQSQNEIVMRFSLVVIFLVVVVVVLLSDTHTSQLQNLFEDFIKSDAGQGESRFNLWVNGLAATNSSPLFGYGPGSFSGDLGPFGAREAHNTYIDASTNVGYVGLAMLLLFNGGILIWSFLAKKHIISALMLALMVYSSFHYILRSPITWIVFAWSVAELTRLRNDYQLRNEIMKKERLCVD